MGERSSAAIAFLVSVLVCVLILAETKAGPGAWNCGEAMSMWNTAQPIGCKELAHGR